MWVPRHNFPRKFFMFFSRLFPPIFSSKTLPKLTFSQQYQSIVDAEWTIIYDKLDRIVKSGANIVLSRLAIGDLATQYFADRGIFAAGRVQDEDLRRVCKATGAQVRSRDLMFPGRGRGENFLRKISGTNDRHQLDPWNSGNLWTFRGKTSRQCQIQLFLRGQTVPNGHHSSQRRRVSSTTSQIFVPVSLFCKDLKILRRFHWNETDSL